MERKKQYNEKQVEQDLYQYEMGIELGADVESGKKQHRSEYQRENQSRDFKNDSSQRNQRQNQQNRNEFSSLNQNNQQNEQRLNSQSQQNRNQHNQQNNRNNFR